MVKKPSKKTTMAKSIAAPTALVSDVLMPGAAESEPAKLRCFSKGDADHPGFSFTRYWWDGEGGRNGIKPWVDKKRWPGDDPRFGAAAKVEVLLPPTAPGIYANADLLLKQFDETLPPFETHTMVQVKIMLHPAEPWHVGYERVRAYVRAHFASRFPVILVAHVPSVAGLDGNGSHIHGIVLSRAIDINGFTGACHKLCSDKGYAAAVSAWQEHQAEEDTGA